jgi:hypothetical protein
MSCTSCERTEEDKLRARIVKLREVLQEIVDSETCDLSNGMCAGCKAFVALEDDDDAEWVTE